MARLKRSLRHAISALPFPVRSRIYRRLVRVDPAPPAALVVEMARTDEDFVGAFRLLHDSYVDEGLMQPHPSGLRVTPYHALPGTRVVVARWNGVVIGTASIIPDSDFGLPMDESFDLSPYRKPGAKLTEVSSMAIAKQYRKTGGTVLFPLLKFIAHHCHKQVGVDLSFISMHPRLFDLYRALFDGQLLADAYVPSYEFAGGAPAMGGYLEWQRCFDFARKVYRGAPAHRDLHAYFTKDLPNFRFPMPETWPAVAAGAAT